MTINSPAHNALPGVRKDFQDQRNVDMVLTCWRSGVHLSPSMSARAPRRSEVRGPYLLPAIPHIALLVTRSPAENDPLLRWFDAQTGASGEGVAALMAHVYKIDLASARARAAVFAQMVHDMR